MRILRSCPAYEMCEKRLCEKSDAKLRAMALELESTERYICAKYECKEQMIHNEFFELIERAKERLIAKYQDRKSKQERLFKLEFARHQRLQNSRQPQPPPQPQAADRDERKDIVFESDVYQRASLLGQAEAEAEAESLGSCKWSCRSERTRW